VGPRRRWLTSTLTPPLSLTATLDEDPTLDLDLAPGTTRTEVIAELPSKGHADIADQLRRAAQSQPLNIAEGAGRTSRPDVAKHYTIARGSAMECAAVLDVMKAQGTIQQLATTAAWTC